MTMLPLVRDGLDGLDFTVEPCVAICVCGNLWHGFVRRNFAQHYPLAHMNPTFVQPEPRRKVAVFEDPDHPCNYVAVVAEGERHDFEAVPIGPGDILELVLEP